MSISRNAPVLCAGFLVVFPQYIQAETVDWDAVETVLVIASPLSYTPVLSGGGKSLSEAELQPQYGNLLSGLLDRNLTSVSLNDVQNNPFQPDLQYRGFTASPLLGLPQGLSVYLDGTRFNEPFGDTVNWDLLPLSALQQVQLVSGSNPVFGQNTLGGALSLKTKKGFDSPGQAIKLQTGRYGQRGVNFESGGNDDELAYYLNLNMHQDDGWRAFSPSRIRQVLATLSHQSRAVSSDVTLAANDNRLVGNGAVPVELIALEGRDAIFTQPDQTETQLRFISINQLWRLSTHANLSANAYLRNNRINTLNGDDSDYEPCDVGFGLTLCEEVGNEESEPLPDDEEEFEYEHPVELVGYGPDVALSRVSAYNPESLDGTINTSETYSQSRGLSLELSGQSQQAQRFTHWLLGTGVDQARTDFFSDTEFALLANSQSGDDRGVSGSGLQDQASRVRLNTRTRHLSAYFSYLTGWQRSWSLTVAGRFNRSDIHMQDHIETGPGSLNGDHKFQRFNPSVSLGWRPQTGGIRLTWSQSTRTPSPAELSCADELDPCKLPNGFVADPPLEQVVTSTWELAMDWDTDFGQLYGALYRSVSADDILFQQAGDRPSVGYFVNLDRTRRQGAEMGWQYQRGDWHWDTRISFLQATFESPFVSFSPQNPQGASRQVQPGDRIPGQPAWQGGVNLTYQLSDAFLLVGEIDYVSGQYFRGDEANENRMLGAYTLVNLAVRYQFSAQLHAGVRIDNLFDKKFETFGTYGEADEVLGELYPQIKSSEFVGVGQPGMLSAFLTYEF